MVDKAFIELDFPIREVSDESVYEKNQRIGSISTLHTWWARRPLGSSRASIYAALTPAPRDDEQRKRRMQFIAALSKWQNPVNEALIEQAKKEVLVSNGGTPPKVLDPFAGGGSIPLEAVRLGCEVYASDLNPVAVLIEKATLEYPPKFGGRQLLSDHSFGEIASNPLVADLSKWADLVNEEAKKELGAFYPSDPSGLIPIGYLWAKTVMCNSPNCGAEIPLIKQTWLSRRDEKKVAYKIITNANEISFEIKAGDSIDFNPDIGTVSKAKAICPRCGSGLDSKEIKKQFEGGPARQRMVVVALRNPRKKGKTYRVATQRDLDVFLQAQKHLEGKRVELVEKWNFDPVPDEATPEGKGSGAERAFSIRNYGLNKWGDLFNARQILTLITFLEKVKQAYKDMMDQGYDKEYARAIVTYLACTFDRMAMSYNTLTDWQPRAEKVGKMFSRHTISMVWDYAEPNPMNEGARSWESLFSDTTKVVSSCSEIGGFPATISQASATVLPYPDCFFDAIITDPPYYDNVPYSYLSDFFYVWLKRVLGDLYPSLFATPLTPKAEEIVAYSYGAGGFKEGKKFFEDMIAKAFQEIARVLKPEGIACIVFAHKSTEAWEAIINALLNSGLFITASWPVHTERTTRVRGQGVAALASSIYMVCRKRTEVETAYFSDVKPKIESRIKEKLEQFWEEGIGGSDFFISAIGPAFEVFGKYDAVERLSGEKVSASELLEFVRKSVSEYALTKILKSPKLGEVDEETRFYLLWRWMYNSARVPFDDARKLAQAVGIEITDEWGNGFIEKDKESVRVSDATKRGERLLEKKRFASMIDVLHACLIYWGKNSQKQISELLAETGYLNNNSFWQVAQAISEVLAERDAEKLAIQGFLYGKEAYTKAVAKTDKHQKTLFDSEVDL